ncbi:hypothetical protein DMH08_25580 [Actinomadura sp. WAC 06369]|nr:hypothetical protein DMH08_25580 [Actinomadura sp. WAC 06369]
MFGVAGCYRAVLGAAGGLGWLAVWLGRVAADPGRRLTVPGGAGGLGGVAEPVGCRGLFGAGRVAGEAACRVVPDLGSCRAVLGGAGCRGLVDAGGVPEKSGGARVLVVGRLGGLVGGGLAREPVRA